MPLADWLGLCTLGTFLCSSDTVLSSELLATLASMLVPGNQWPVRNLQILLSSFCCSNKKNFTSSSHKALLYLLQKMALLGFFPTTLPYACFEPTSVELHHDLLKDSLLTELQLFCDKLKHIFLACRHVLSQASSLRRDFWSFKGYVV